MKTINLYFDFEFTSLSPDAQPISLGIVSDDINKTLMPPCDVYHESVNYSKSFYAEFTDFDINRCDDWVKENVVGKLIGTGIIGGNGTSVYANTRIIKRELIKFLGQFSDYQIQFVG
jgi:hypothetical protein